jgi:hypothetical protein
MPDSVARRIRLMTSMALLLGLLGLGAFVGASSRESHSGIFRATLGPDGYRVVGAATPEAPPTDLLDIGSSIQVEVRMVTMHRGLGWSSRRQLLFLLPATNTRAVTVRAYGTVRGEHVSTIADDPFRNDPTIRQALDTLRQAQGLTESTEPVDEKAEISSALRAVAASIVDDGPPYLLEAAPLVAIGGGEIRSEDPFGLAVWRGTAAVLLGISGFLAWRLIRSLRASRPSAPAEELDPFGSIDHPPSKAQ